MSTLEKHIIFQNSKLGKGFNLEVFDAFFIFSSSTKGQNLHISFGLKIQSYSYLIYLGHVVS
jgi:hypothetical protein